MTAAVGHEAGAAPLGPTTAAGVTFWTVWEGDRTADRVRDFLRFTDAGDRLVIHDAPGWDVEGAGSRLAELLNDAVPRSRAVDIALSTRPPTFADVVDGRHVQVGTPRPGLDAPVVAGFQDTTGLEAARAAASPPPGRPQRVTSERVVEVAFMGGLGNQLFQYALGRTVADRLGAELVADVEWFDRQQKNSWELDAYRVRVDAVVHGPEDRVALGWRPLRRREEASFRHDPTLIDSEPGTSLHGYFQSEQYFAENAVQLREDLRPALPLSPWARTVAESIVALPNPSSLHVRRGDYASEPDVQAVHGTCSPRYYERALSVLDSLAGDLDVVVFSDDPGWADRNVVVAPSRSALTVYPPSESPAWENLYLMSLAVNAVIANSTFSWWGAWLRARSGAVIAPRPWFRADMDTRDLLPPTWLTLDSR